MIVFVVFIRFFIIASLAATNSIKLFELIRTRLTSRSKKLKEQSQTVRRIAKFSIFQGDVIRSARHVSANILNLDDLTSNSVTERGGRLTRSCLAGNCCDSDERG